MESNNICNPNYGDIIGEHPKTLKPNRHVFSNRIYASHPEQQHRGPPHNTLKSLSLETFEQNHLNQVQQKINVQNDLQDLALSDIKDSCTQTSKTIIQLARMEKGRISPDSLTQSPRNSHNVSNQNAVATPIHNYDLPYMRKNNIMHYLEGIEQHGNIPLSPEKRKIDKTFPDKSLTQAFLAKKKSDSDTLYKNVDTTSVGDSRSRFLQQTSPLKNLIKNSSLPAEMKVENFKSKSYIEMNHPNYIHEEKKPIRVPQPATRFTVKKISECVPVDRIKPVKFYSNLQYSELSSPKMETDSIASPSTSFKTSDLSSGNTSNTPRDIYKNKRSNSFMSPTLSSEQKSKRKEIKMIAGLISPSRRGRSVSPDANSPVSDLVEPFCKSKIPYIDQSNMELISNNKCPRTTSCRKNISKRDKSPQDLLSPLSTKSGFEEDLLIIDGLSLDNKASEESVGRNSTKEDTNSTSSIENTILAVVNRVKDPHWATALKGLAEMTELCRTVDPDNIFPHMTTINQRLLELLRSPRSHVCRTACQATGHFFESMKDTRRPEFDDIVDILLCKTADTNKFIRKDANLSLDCMVTHIPTFQSIRALCAKGPTHKNPLVRTATIRLIICAVVIAGPNSIINGTGTDPTRKRVIQNMALFLQDRNFDARKFGERLYKILSKEENFDHYLKKYLESKEIQQLKKSLKLMNVKR